LHITTTRHSGFLPAPVRMTLMTLNAWYKLKCVDRRHAWRTYVVDFGAGHAWLDKHGR